MTQLGLPHWDGQSMHLTAPGNTTMGDGSQRAARGTYLWSPDDPLVFSLHMEVALTSVPMNPHNFPGVRSEEDVVLCPRCSHGMPWDEFCVPVTVGSNTAAWCMRCAEENDFADINESIWVLGLEFLNAAADDSLGMPEQDSAALARVWRSGPMALSFAFTQAENTMFYITEAQGARLFVDAVKDFSKKSNFTEAYLALGVSALERLANKEND